MCAPSKDTAHESAEAANAAHAADARAQVSHHESLQAADAIRKRLDVVRRSDPQEDEDNDVVSSDDEGSQHMGSQAMFDDFGGGLPSFDRKGSHSVKSSKSLPEEAHPSLPAATQPGPTEEPKRRRKMPPKCEVVPPPANVAAPANPQTSSTAAVVAKAREDLDKYYKAFTDEKIWDAKIKSRTLETMQKALNQRANAVACLNSQDPAVQTLANSCMEFADLVGEKMSAVQCIKQAPEAAATSFAENMAAAIRKMSPPVLSNILVWTAGQILKDVEQAGTFLIAKTPCKGQVFSRFTVYLPLGWWI